MTVSLSNRDGVLLEDDALVVRLAGELSAASRSGTFGLPNAWWDAWSTAVCQWRRSGRPHLLIDTTHLVCSSPAGITLLARAREHARRAARSAGRESENVQILGAAVPLMALRSRCLAEDLWGREQFVLRLLDLGMGCREILPFLGSHKIERVMQAEQSGKFRLERAMARRLALSVRGSEARPGATEPPEGAR